MIEKKGKVNKTITITLDEKRALLIEKMANDKGIKKSALISLWIEQHSREEAEVVNKN